MNLYVFEPRTERTAGLARELRGAGLTVRFVEAALFAAGARAIAAGTVAEAGFLIADTAAAPAQVAAIRAAGSGGPVVVMRDMRNAQRAAELLDAGADDDVVIPLKGAELVARLRSIRRRAAGHAAGAARVGELTVHFDGREPEIGAAQIHLSGREHAIFQHLAMHAGRIVSKHALYDALYGLSEERPYDKVIDVYICKLRKKLAAASAVGHAYIETVHGRGYTLTAPAVAGVIAAE